VSAHADTSALRRLLIDDEVSAPLEDYLPSQDALATCDLTRTELHRVGGRHGIDADVIEDLLDPFDRVPLTEALSRQAGLLHTCPALTCGAWTRSTSSPRWTPIKPPARRTTGSRRAPQPRWACASSLRGRATDCYRA